LTCKTSTARTSNRCLDRRNRRSRRYRKFFTGLPARDRLNGAHAQDICNISEPIFFPPPAKILLDASQSVHSRVLFQRISGLPLNREYESRAIFTSDLDRVEPVPPMFLYGRRQDLTDWNAKWKRRSWSLVRRPMNAAAVRTRSSMMSSMAPATRCTRICDED